MRFSLQNYNEFRGEIRWHDYASIIINEFPILLIRRYDWMDDMNADGIRRTTQIQVLGFVVFHRNFRA